MKRLHSAITLLILSTPILASATPATDFDSDGISDQVVVSIQSGTGALDWTARLSSSSSEQSLGEFGENGDHLILGNWEGTGTNIGVIEELSDTSVRWKILKGDSTTGSYDLGKPSDLFMSGADFDGSGALDACVVAQSGNSLVWTIVADPFKSASAQTQSSFALGDSNSLPFYFNPRGTGDFAMIEKSATIAGVSRKIMKGRSLTGVKFKKVLLPKSVSSAGRPLPLMKANGKDILVFVRQASAATRLTLVSAKGRLLRRITVPLTGTVIVGDFIPGGDEEVLVSDSEGAAVVASTSGQTESIVAPSGIPVDEINLNSFSGGSNPGICEIGDPTDGGGKFVYKPRSDTQHYAVVVLPGRFTGRINEVSFETTQGAAIESLRYKGLGNPDSEGQRSNWISGSYTGQSLKSQYGYVVIRVIFSDDSCLLYTLDNPAQRYD